jgi:hypothetical protein
MDGGKEALHVSVVKRGDRAFEAGLERGNVIGSGDAECRERYHQRERNQVLHTPLHFLVSSRWPTRRIRRHCVIQLTGSGLLEKSGTLRFAAELWRQLYTVTPGSGGTFIGRRFHYESRSSDIESNRDETTGFIQLSLPPLMI